MTKSKSILRALAISQLALIGVETIVGLIVAGSFPNEGGNRIFNSIATMLFLAFAIPAIMTVLSAAVLAKPKNKIASAEAKRAFSTQKILFVLCILLVIPSFALASQGFVFFAVNCVLGIVLWPLVNKESKNFDFGQ